jgi:hypothetical protein
MEALHESEKFFIWFLGTTKKSLGYNLTLGGEGGVATEETRRKMSLAAKGRKLSLQTREKIRAALLANHFVRKSPPHDDEWRRKVSLKMKGRVFSEAHRAKLSKSATGRIMPPVSEELRKKVSARFKGRPSPTKGKTWSLSEEQRQKISERLTGKKLSLAHRNSLSEAAKRRAASPEGKANLEFARSRQRHKSMTDPGNVALYEQRKAESA